VRRRPRTYGGLAHSAGSCLPIRIQGSLARQERDFRDSGARYKAVMPLYSRERLGGERYARRRRTDVFPVAIIESCTERDLVRAVPPPPHLFFFVSGRSLLYGWTVSQHANKHACARARDLALRSGFWAASRWCDRIKLPRLRFVSSSPCHLIGLPAVCREKHGSGELYGILVMVDGGGVRWPSDICPDPDLAPCSSSLHTRGA
jgi:hypothetical protein